MQHILQGVLPTTRVYAVATLTDMFFLNEENGLFLRAQFRQVPN